MDGSIYSTILLLSTPEYREYGVSYTESLRVTLALEKIGQCSVLDAPTDCPLVLLTYTEYSVHYYEGYNRRTKGDLWNMYPVLVNIPPSAFLLIYSECKSPSNFPPMLSRLAQ